MEELRKRMFTVEEVAKLVPFSASTLRKAIKMGQIKVMRISKSVRIPAAEVERLLQGETLS